MSLINRALYLLIHDRARFCDSIVKRFLLFLPDKIYISLRYRCLFGRWIDWSNPKAFTEKLQWLKIYDRKPEYTVMVDKAAVKKYISDIIGEEYIIPTINVWDKPEDICWDTLPDKFVLKTTHGGGGSGVVICKDKQLFSIEDAISTLKKSLKADIYNGLREWPYKNVKKRVICEEYISEGKELKDYKFFCFGGRCEFFKVDYGRFVEHHANYYSRELVLQEFGEKDLMPQLEYTMKLPSNIGEMISIAELLSKGHTFLRVDLYNLNGRIYFGELTFYPASGLGKFSPEIWDYKLGELIKLPTQ